MSAFEILNKVNVNEHTEKKNGLTYLSWSYAWAEVKKAFPNASYEIIMHDGLPYVYDENTGYMVFTTVTIEEQTHMMWLPVMDGANKAMKNAPYTYTVKSYGKEVEKTVAAATMFDINKTIMRCLVKNLAMFGLGLYIYAGEDLPEEEKKADADLTYHGEGMTQERLYKLEKEMERTKVTEASILKVVGVKQLEDMTEAQYIAVMNKLARTADARQTA